MTDIANRLEAACQRLAKWRMVFTGWQLGTRSQTDPEAQAVRDHREATILLRAEVNALTALLIDKGGITLEQFQAQLLTEVEELSRAYEKRFPGFKATDYGMKINAVIAADTTRGWRP